MNDTEAESGWVTAKSGSPGVNAALAFSNFPTHHLTPATLPDMLEGPIKIKAVRFISSNVGAGRIDLTDHCGEEEAQWNALLRQEPMQVPPQTRRGVILDLENYACAYTQLITDGGKGSTIRLRWAEALFDDPDAKPGPIKGHRDEIDSKVLLGYGDTFRLDGKRRAFAPPLWRPGRYLELLIETDNEALTIERFELLKTHYPLTIDTEFACDDTELQKALAAGEYGGQRFLPDDGEPHLCPIASRV